MKDDGDNKKIPDNPNYLNIDKNILEKEDYQKYKVNDVTISIISYDNIEDKMNNLIEMKKNDFLKYEEMKNQTKLSAEEFEDEKDEKKEGQE